MRLGWIRASLRRLGDDRVATLGLAGLVLVTALLFALAPRAFDLASNTVLRDEVRAAPVITRSIQFVEDAALRPGGDGEDPMVEVVARGERLDTGLPSALDGLVGIRSWQVESGRYQVIQNGDPVFFRLRLQEGIDEHVRYVAGHPPTGATATLDRVIIDKEEFTEVPVLEVALAGSTAAEFHLRLGDTAVLGSDSTDALVGRGPRRAAAIKVVGLYEAIRSDDPYWLGDAQLQHPLVRALTGDVRYLDAAALVAPAAYRALLTTLDPERPLVRYTWRRFVDPERLTMAAIPAVLEDLRQVQVMYPSVNPSPVYETGYRTGLLGLLEAEQARWTSATAILAVVVVGPAVIAAAALALIALLGARRRRATLAVSRSRGASAAQLVTAVVAEGLVITAPAALAAALTACALIPGGPVAPTAVAAAVVATCTTLILVVASVPSAAGRQGSREAATLHRATPRRLVMEATLVAMALAAAWLLRERGVHGASTARTLETADPLIAAVPGLVGLAAGVIAVRLLPVPMRLLAWLAATRPGLVPVLAMRRATTGSGAGPVLIVLLATATIGAFSAAALVHLERAAETVAWQEIGAAYRVAPSSGRLPAAFDPDALPGAEASASLYRTAIPVGLTGPRVELLVVDTAALERVTSGTPADPRLPADLVGPGGNPIPALVSSSLAARGDGLTAGETFELSVEGYTLRYRAAAVRDTFPGLPADRHFIVVARAHFLALAPTAPLQPVAALIRAPDSVGADLRAAAESEVSGAIVDSRAERSAALRGSPVTAMVRAGIVAAATVTALYAAIAVAAALALAGLARAIEIAHLRTLGLTRREAVGLVAVEHGPIVVVALGIGLALGLAMFVLLRDGLGLSALVGSPVDVPLTVDGASLALVLATMVAVIVVGLAMGTVLQRSAIPMTAIRRGFE